MTAQEKRKCSVARQTKRAIDFVAVAIERMYKAYDKATCEADCHLIDRVCRDLGDIKNELQIIAPRNAPKKIE